MFCPKCGTQNPETGRFCRSCGADLGNVSAALSGNLPAQRAETGVSKIGAEAQRQQDPHELFGNAVSQSMTGVGFLVASIALLITGVAGGRFWWWTLLFPAFGCLGKGVSDYLKSKRLEQSRAMLPNQSAPAALHQVPAASALASADVADAQIRRLLSSGNKIEAIKVYREATGADLKTAKEEVERLERERIGPSDYMAPPARSIYDTGELPPAPPSVTEETTRHLDIDSEGQTMTLPKK